MKSLLDKTHLIGKKIIFIGIIISFSYVMAGDFDLPNHDEIKKEVTSLIENDLVEKSKATVLQKIKRCASQNDGYVEITRENAPNIYKLLNSAANTIGIDIPSKVYLNKSHVLSLNCCNAFVAKNLNGKIYLSLGNKLLCELTPQETKAILEHEFMHIKDKFLEQLTPKMYKNGVVACSYLGLLGIQCVLLVHISKTIYSKKYSNAALMALPIPLLTYLSGKLGRQVIDNKTQINDFCQKLEQHADLNVESKTDLANGLKKIIAMITIEALKYNPKSIDPSAILLIETEMQNAIIKNIDNGKMDSNDPLHPTLQNRLNYLKEATETTTSNIV
ncbi:MAG: hypothetical protein V1646_03050 [bacterium]